MWITAISVVIASFVIFVLPYQNIVLRTVHELNIRVLDKSAPVVIEDWSGTYGNPVALEEMTTTGDVLDDAVILQSGGTLSYTREMTGGFKFHLERT